MHMILTRSRRLTSTADTELKIVIVIPSDNSVVSYPTHSLQLSLQKGCADVLAGARLITDHI